jgi:phage recombination protein Bet
MAVKNQLVKSGQKDKGEFSYLANGEEVRLSASMVKKYLVSGDAEKITDQEVMMFLTLCKYQHLNPFLREAYLIKYGNKDATIVTGKDTFLKRAAKNPKYLGKESGIIVDSDEGIVHREGTFHMKGEQIVGGWAKIFVEGRQPELYTVSFDEYAGRKSDGTLNNQWATKPATMIRKVAVVQGLRECFPEDFEGLLAPEEISAEMPNVDEIVNNSAPIDVEAVEKPLDTKPSEIEAENKRETSEENNGVADALFGKGAE